MLMADHLEKKKKSGRKMLINGLLTAYRITYGKNIRDLWFMINGSLENVTQIM